MIYDLNEFEEEFLSESELAELTSEELSLSELGDEELIEEFNELSDELDYLEDFE